MTLQVTGDRELIAQVRTLRADGLELAADNARLRAAISAVEWVTGLDTLQACPWCGGFAPGQPGLEPGHRPDCARQLAILRST